MSCLFDTSNWLLSLEQWFPTGVPRHTRVPWEGCRGAAKYWIDCLFVCVLLLRVPQIVIFGMSGCRQIFLAQKGAVNSKRLKNTALDKQGKVFGNAAQCRKGMHKLGSSSTIPMSVQYRVFLLQYGVVTLPRSIHFYKTQTRLLLLQLT